MQHELRSWHDHLIAVTEPLSEPRIQGDLLNEIDQFLRTNPSDGEIRQTVALMVMFSHFKIYGRINRLAVDGSARAQALAQGGKARARMGAEKLKLVCKHAEKCWQTKANLRGNRACTAETIEPAVNDELRALGEKPLRPKRIADLISKGISGRLLHIGEFGIRNGQSRNFPAVQGRK
jgi:hypothetical protein